MISYYQNVVVILVVISIVALFGGAWFYLVVSLADIVDLLVIEYLTLLIRVQILDMFF